jgi:hydroxypyruvate isomerase
MTRREILATGAAAVAAGLPSLSFGAQAPAPPALATPVPTQPRVVTKGRLKQSVARWCYASIPMPAFCKAVSEMGLTAIDLLRPNEWDALQPYGLKCSLAYAGADSIPKGFNDPANHDSLVAGLTQGIPAAAKAGIPNVIAFFGNVQPNISEAQAIDNCIAGIKRVSKVAEDNGVTLVVELLNSKVNHKGYQGDHTAFGVKVIQGVGSPRVKLLYDIYHMQIMEGDIIATIRQNISMIGHFHTGGVPGRHELDQTQELDWRAVSKAIADLGYAGYVSHEFTPTRDPLTSLREAITLCDV